MQDCQHLMPKALCRLCGPEEFLNGKVRLYGGDNRELLKSIPDDSIDSIVCDPPYALVSIVKRFGGANAAPAKGNEAYMRASAGFMGKQWDTGDTAHAVEFWQECLRVLKPGGHVVAFAGTRTYHRMAVAIEDAGFEIRDQLGWCFGSGFPKSHNVALSIDKAAGAVGNLAKSFNMKVGGDRSDEFAENGRDFSIKHDPATDAAREWQGWGTALKPAWEPICLGRKPLSERTVAANVLKWGTGAINVDSCRVSTDELTPRNNANTATIYEKGFEGKPLTINPSPLGRWPANLLHDGSEEVLAAFPDAPGQLWQSTAAPRKTGNVYGDAKGPRTDVAPRDEGGSAARFFYSCKADADDRLGSKHPTVKPIDLMQWLVRLVTPKGGTVLDPFAGTGTTAEACFREGMSCILMERETEYQADIRRRMALVLAGPEERGRESIKAKLKDAPLDAGPLFAGL